MAFEQVMGKAFGCSLIAAVFHENINNIAVLIDRTPEAFWLTFDRDKAFVAMPGIPQPPLLFLKLGCIVRPEILTPLTDSFIGGRDSTFGS
ncbi:MAG: hypothetical protein R3B95_18630 [Nitrospirales bacterium]|nr:hypothetical protein [Nitrospirales bacterium]